MIQLARSTKPIVYPTWYWSICSRYEDTEWYDDMVSCAQANGMTARDKIAAEISCLSMYTLPAAARAPGEPVAGGL